MASERLATWSLAKMLVMWFPTVAGARANRLAIVALPSPLAMRSSTSRSRRRQLGKGLVGARAGQVAQRLPGDTRAEDRLAGGHGGDRADDVVRRRLP